MKVFNQVGFKILVLIFLLTIPVCSAKHNSSYPIYVSLSDMNLHSYEITDRIKAENYIDIIEGDHYINTTHTNALLNLSNNSAYTFNLKPSKLQTTTSPTHIFNYLEKLIPVIIGLLIIVFLLKKFIKRW